jgi:hypothetical protein
LIVDLIKDQEQLKKQLAQAQGLIFKLQGAIEYIDQKIKEDFEKNKPKPEDKINDT